MNEAETRAELIDPKLYGEPNISRLFIEFQEHLYKQKVA